VLDLLVQRSKELIAVGLLQHVPPNPNIIGDFDFSDATYINRHKKYAVVEKRHRLREQEMVQWELSKLPAKISQLRALDVNVFKGVCSPSVVTAQCGLTVFRRNR
jgi:hypothetical protein